MYILRLIAALSASCAWAGSMAQVPDDLMTNVEIGERIRSLAVSGAETRAEQVKLVWILMLRSSQGDRDAHKVGRAPAERLKNEDDLDFRSKFVYGYFRLREAYDTRDPITRKRRVDEGRRMMTTSLPVGARDVEFQMDAGLVLAGLLSDVDLFREAINSLTLAKRLYGDTFSQLPKSRLSDWHGALGTAYGFARLHEVARDHFKAALDLAPESPAGRKAIAWLRNNGA